MKYIYENHVPFSNPSKSLLPQSNKQMHLFHSGWISLFTESHDDLAYWDIHQQRWETIYALQSNLGYNYFAASVPVYGKA